MQKKFNPFDKYKQPEEALTTIKRKLTLKLENFANKIRRDKEIIKRLN